VNAPTASRLQIVHVSDLHISELRRGMLHRAIARAYSGFGCASPKTMRALEQAGALSVRALPDALTCCVASGDLTALGGAREFVNALGYLRSTFPGLGSGLRYSTGADYVLGNHDVWGGAIRRGALGTRAKSKVVDDHASSRPNMRMFDRDHVDIGTLRVRLYGIDSTRSGFRNWLAGGRVTEGEQKRLQERVASDERADRQDGVTHCLRIAVAHHPVVAEQAWCGQLENATEFGTLLDAMHFGLVLGGHEHDQWLWQAPSGRLQGVAGSATQEGERNAFLIYTIPAAVAGSTVLVDVASYERGVGAGFTVKPEPGSPYSVPVAHV
jgi:hypothetical protein